MTTLDVSGLLARWRRDLGGLRVYGAPNPHLEVIAVDRPERAAELAAADAELHGTVALVSEFDGSLRVGTTEGGRPATTVDDAGTLAELLASIGSGELTSALLRLDLDPATPAGPLRPPVRPERWIAPPAALVAQLAAAEAPVLVVGAGVIRAGAIDGLHALAAGAQLGVLNTWDAKGVFDWRSVHHWATVGLQRDDLALAGLADADLVLTSGLERSVFGAHPLLAGAHDLVPQMLGPLAEACHRPARELLMPPLRDRLAAATQRGWAEQGAPLWPTRATLHYGQALPTGGLIVGEPGTAGFYLARTFATTELGSARVPIGPVPPGWSLAASFAAQLARPGRAVLAVLDERAELPVDDWRELAERHGLRLVVERWAPDGEPLDAAAHAARTAELFSTARSAEVTLRTERGQLAEMIAAAGPITAWRSAGRDEGSGITYDRH